MSHSMQPPKKSNGSSVQKASVDPRKEQADVRQPSESAPSPFPREMDNVPPVTADNVLYLQRLIGNRATAQAAQRLTPAPKHIQRYLIPLELHVLPDEPTTEPLREALDDLGDNILKYNKLYRATDKSTDQVEIMQSYV